MNQDASTRCALPSHLAPQVVCDLERFGNANDGGYVVQRKLVEQADWLISLGLGDDWSFDTACLQSNSKLRIIACDHTVSREHFVRKIVFAVAKVVLGRARIADISRAFQTYRSYVSFFGRDRDKGAFHIQKRVHNRNDDCNDITLSEILSFSGAKSAILKIDIEGAEYRIVDDIIKFSQNISILVIEFHDIDPFRELFFKCMHKLMAKYTIIHMHANNYGGVSSDGLPEVLEVSFSRSDLCDCCFRSRKRLPLDTLDAPNNPNRPDIVVIFEKNEGQMGTFDP